VHDPALHRIDVYRIFQGHVHNLFLVLGPLERLAKVCLVTSHVRYL
jgi:hypothetical protein